jgi:choloylglycine hydrolase
MKLDIASTVLSLSMLFCVTLEQPALACTDFLVKANDGSVIVGRSMEWGEDMKSQLGFQARGEARQSTTPDGKPGLNWQSKYGFVCANCYGLDIPIDGMNEKGFSVGALWFPGAIYQSPVAGREQSTMDPADLVAWLLGSFSTVDEATSALKNVRVCLRSRPDIGFAPNIHFALHDPTGASAAVEYVKGELRMYPNKGGVLTNAPDFEWHVTNLSNYLHLDPVNPQPVKLAGSVLAPPGQGSGFLGIPGDWTPPSRFVRTSTMLAFAQPAKTASDAELLAQHILNAVDIPLGDVRDKTGKTIHQDYTQWALIKDLSNRVLYFRSYNDQALQSINLKHLNFDPGQKSNQIPISSGSAMADVTDRLAR